MKLEKGKIKGYVNPCWIVMNLIIHDKKQTCGTLKMLSINRTLDLPVNENSPWAHSGTGNKVFQHPENLDLHFLPGQ